MDILDSDKYILQELGKEVLRLSQNKKFEKMRKQWVQHNDLVSQQSHRVLIYPDQDGVWDELIPQNQLKVQTPFLRQIEFILRQKIYRAKYFPDDFVIEPDILLEIPGEYSGYHYAKDDQKSAWGLPMKGSSKIQKKGAYKFNPVLNNEKDLEIFFEHKLTFVMDKTLMSNQNELIENIFSGILPVKREIPYVVLVCSLLIELVHIRGMETMFFDIYDTPDLLHKILNHMSEQKLELIRRLESNQQLLANNEDHWTGAGGVGYSDALVASSSPMKLHNLWGFADAQEFSSVSIPMWEEFVLSKQAVLLNTFGYSCYGCCESMDGRYEQIFKALPNLRRISISPWADINEAAESIGRKAIYSWKPNPSLIANGFDEADEGKKLREFQKITKNNFTEIILKDLRTCEGNPEHLIRWVRLAQRIFKENE